MQGRLARRPSSVRDSMDRRTRQGAAHPREAASSPRAAAIPGFESSHCAIAERKFVVARRAPPFEQCHLRGVRFQNRSGIDVTPRRSIVTPVIARLVIMAAALSVAELAARFEAAQQDAEVTYTVSPLASLGGASSRGNGVNGGGLVSGFSNRAPTVRRATVWASGVPHDLGTLGGPNSSVAWSGLSNSGLVVGIAQTNQPQTRTDGWSCRIFFPGPDNTKYTCLGFAWDGGVMQPLAALGGDNSFAASSNNRRQVVGWAETTVEDFSCIDPPQRQFLPVLWDLNTHQAIALPPYPGDRDGAATAINDRGQVVGISGDCDQSVGRRSARHAVLWDQGTVHDLGSLGNDTWNTPTAITANGDIIVGFGNAAGADPDDPQFRAWLWTKRDDIACEKLPGTDLCDLGTLDVGGTSEAWGVNEHGQIVGTSCPPSGDCRAFVWENGVMVDLNLQKADYPHHLENAMDINNRGQITGRALTPTGREAFLATPRRR
jgi:probable HAF family extracellular repeat protein